MVKTIVKIGKKKPDVNKIASSAIKKKSNTKKPAKKTPRLKPIQR
jgi:hypothetical protein